MSDDMLELSPKVRLGTKKKKAEDSGNKNGKSRRRSSSVTQEVGDWKEVWVHESCSVYSDGVFLIGSKIYGLQEAVRIASQTPCSVCNEMGAMIGCLNKGCQQKFHHACAQGAECYLDEENFSLLCPKHKVKKLKQLEEASTSTSVG
ncbi:transcription factor 20-like [Ruditapes philippinarum]|uniref:transcription factor 20-like n=1 Tax=Ruditapes philippinarum TaxID=129788 RepID=UPI00295C0161|nr:transcription factor 20-like [Ruditapes philippinarum]